MFSVELYGRVRHACHVEGLSQREAARRFGIHRNTVRKMLAFAVPPGYRRTDRDNSANKVLMFPQGFTFLE
jgi:transposase